MFNDDEVRSAFNKMYEYSPVDGFVEISEGLGEMIKSLANEPSVGLFYVQQHAHNAVPNLVNLRNNVVTKSREMSLHTEDSEDSIAIVRSMKECGFPIVNEMVTDITKSLAIMSTKQPKKGLISSNKPVSWSPTNWRRNNNNEGQKSNYLSNVLKSAKQKATNIKWAPLDTFESMEEVMQTSAAASTSTKDELPVSNLIGNEVREKEAEVEELISNLSLSEKFDEFKADKEAKLEEWLGGRNEEERID